jgi:Flp pilus assembly protein TadG
MMILQKCARIRNKKGQALIETALSIFILFLLVFGIIEFGRAMYTKNTLNNAARAGVRQAVVTLGISNASTTDLTKSFNCSNNNDCVYQAISNSIYNGIDKSNVTVTISGASNPTAKSGDTINIQVVLNQFTSFVPKLIKVGASLTGTASMRYE